MSKVTRVTLALVATALVAASLAACGGGGTMPADAVAQVGETAITKASLNHWMSTIIGGDFYEITHKVAPTGMVSEPPDYATCTIALETLPSSSGKTKPPAVQLKSKCEQLYHALKQQTLSYLISAQVAVGQDRDQGLKVTGREVEQAFKRLQASQFPKEAELQQYLANRHWALSDELFLLKRDLLSSKLRAKIEKKYGGATGEQALIKYVHGATTLWIARTTCRSGYVVQGCKQYGPAQAAATAAAPSPDALIEELVRSPS
jgi:hypothetical protein